MKNKYVVTVEYELETDSILPEIFYSGPGTPRVTSIVQFVSQLVDQVGIDSITSALVVVDDLDQVEEEPPQEDEMPPADSGIWRDWID